MKLKRRSSTDSTIPTSSMADIAFLLIIFFMVTSVFSATKGLELTLPTDAPGDPIPEPDAAIFIHVRSDGVLVDCREMGAEQIRNYLRPILGRNPNKPVILYTASDAEYRRMIEIYDQLIAFARNIFVPTRSDLHEYETLFGQNPLDSACR